MTRFHRFACDAVGLPLAKSSIQSFFFHWLASSLPPSPVCWVLMKAIEQAFHCHPEIDCFFRNSNTNGTLLVRAFPLPLFIRSRPQYAAAFWHWWQLKVVTRQEHHRHSAKKFVHSIYLQSMFPCTAVSMSQIRHSSIAKAAAGTVIFSTFVLVSSLSPKCSIFMELVAFRLMLLCIAWTLFLKLFRAKEAFNQWLDNS